MMYELRNKGYMGLREPFKGAAENESEKRLMNAEVMNAIKSISPTS
jgi:hypothetical protein